MRIVASMSSQTPQDPSFMPLRRAASLVGVPTKFLRREAEAGTVPFIFVNRRMMFDPSQVAQALREKAMAAVEARR